MWVSILSSMALPVFSTGKGGSSDSAIDGTLLNRKSSQNRKFQYKIETL